MKNSINGSTDQRPFAGLKVIDITHVLAGPACTYLLAQLGAEVIKVEEPGKGDTVRNRGGSIDELKRQGMGTNYLAQNSNKKSIVVDIKTREGQSLVRKLVEGADIFVENHRGETLSRLNLGPDDLRELNDRLIYCSMSGYGHGGPLGDAPAYDVNVQAASGLMSITGSPKTAPTRTGAPIIDYATGLSAAFAISAALVQRQTTGLGDFIDVSMLDTAMFLMCSTVADYMTSGNEPEPKGNTANSGLPTSGNFQTSNGVISLGINEEHQFRRFAKATGRLDLLEDKRFAALKARQVNGTEIKTEISNIMMLRSATEWEKVLLTNGVPASRVNTVAEILNSPHIQQRNIFTCFDAIDGLDRPITVLKAPFRYGSGNGPSIETPPPKLGEDTMTILEEAGFSDKQISSLLSKHIVK